MYDLDNPPVFDPMCESKGEAEQRYDSDAQCSLCTNIYTIPYFDARPHGNTYGTHTYASSYSFHTYLSMYIYTFMYKYAHTQKRRGTYINMFAHTIYTQTDTYTNTQTRPHTHPFLHDHKPVLDPPPCDVVAEEVAYETGRTQEAMHRVRPP